ncbi:MAG: hypothetical protein U0R49_04065 [Fimbriimonadales bacterium]
MIAPLHTPRLPFEKLMRRVHRKYWWHGTPDDPDAFKKRGQFFASTYLEAEMYHRHPQPYKVKISKPLIGDENAIMFRLFGSGPHRALDLYQECLSDDLGPLDHRFELDALMKERAVELGYDSILLMSAYGYRRYRTGRLPRSLELNTFNV